MAWFRWDGPDLLLSVYVQPGASRAAIAGVHGDALKVRVTAPPQGGRANHAVTGMLARRLGVSSKSVVVQQGGKSRRKVLRVVGIGHTGRLCELLGLSGAGEKPQQRR